MAAPLGSQELEDVDPVEVPEGAGVDDEALGSDEEGPADEPQAASRDTFNQRWSKGKATPFKGASRFIPSMTTDAKRSRSGVPHGKVNLPEMIMR